MGDGQVWSRDYSTRARPAGTSDAVTSVGSPRPNEEESNRCLHNFLEWNLHGSVLKHRVENNLQQIRNPDWKADRFLHKLRLYCSHN